MGAYTLKQIDSDFDNVTRFTYLSEVEELKRVARNIIVNYQDNDAKDSAISNLLQAARMLFYSYVICDFKKQGGV